MTSITVYGASDDLVEIEGAIHEEFNWCQQDDAERRFLAFSDGTVLEVVYDNDGIWRFPTRQQGSAAIARTEATPDAGTDYSDIVTMSGSALRWVVFGERYEHV